MDYRKIGDFIATERKAKKLTQAKLAEKLFISEKTVSKWENGKGIPDTSILSKLCEIFDVSINELLNGERISKDEYLNKAEEKLLELQKVKEEGDKRLLFFEIVIGVLSVTILLSLVLIAAFVDMPDWLRIIIIAFGFIMGVVGVLFALKIEQIAGFYICPKCQHKYVPTYSQVLGAPHINRTRRMKCPHCKKRSWHKKVTR